MQQLRHQPLISSHMGFRRHRRRVSLSPPLPSNGYVFKNGCGGPFCWLGPRAEEGTIQLVQFRSEPGGGDSNLGFPPAAGVSDPASTGPLPSACSPQEAWLQVRSPTGKGFAARPALVRDGGTGADILSELCHAREAREVVQEGPGESNLDGQLRFREPPAHLAQPHSWSQGLFPGQGKERRRGGPSSGQKPQGGGPNSLTAKQASHGDAKQRAYRNGALTSCWPHGSRVGGSL